MQAHRQQFTISNNNNNRANNISNDLNNSNSNNINNSILNNKSDFNGVTNNKIYHHINGNNNNNNNNENAVSKAVILGFDKNKLDYKNNKNLILNQQQNKVDINGNNSLTNNNYNRTSDYEHHQMYEKHLNGINQLKKEIHMKRFIITNGVNDNIINLRNTKFKIVDQAKEVEVVQVNDDEPNIPTNANIHKVNGHLSGFYSNGQNMRNGQNVRITELSTNGHTKNGGVKVNENGCAKAQNSTRKSFARNCSTTNNMMNGRSNDFSTIKINYVSRQVHHGTISNGYVSTNGHATNGNGMHEKTKNAFNTTPNIPNIVINGNATELSDKMVNGALVEEKNEESSMGKQHKCFFFVFLFSCLF
jgi:hypothetical protein